ncbi:peptidase S10 serine carboxypeptidase [Mycena maculata]|uniref:Carboxypeptidase n=1 Tax=Mycena maculata TaxID=230809 RepID=A0AAD7NEZ9_9AGAR|nr:peptidase S10 serine carboxypeptidase [Mycena maculata]
MKFGVLLFAYVIIPAVVGFSIPEHQQQVLGLDSTDGEATIYEHVSHPAFAAHSLRLKKPTLCDDSVKQYSGYLDIGEDKHLFFWFFESRSSPSSDPLVMWLNGGPGCSSISGLLFELGPCSINKDENGTVFTSRNEYGWNQNANVVFLDQPANVGYSYSSSKTEPVKTTPVAADDVYAFLQLFAGRFEEYAMLPFHIAAESYGGHYAPHIATVLHHKNKELIQAPSSDLRKINLESIMIGNGLTDPLIQMPSVVEYACDGPFAVFDTHSRQCRTMRSRGPVCERMIKACYASNSRAVCSPATFYCWSALFSILQGAKRNVYDVRLPCDQSENSLCYEELSWVDEYMNLPGVKRALGADPRAANFTACNTDMTVAFMLQGDGMRDSKRLLTELVDEGIRLLVYAGNVDMVCNYMGESRWIEQLPSKHNDAFTDAPFLPWTVSDRPAGVVRSAGEGAGNVTYLTVYEAGYAHWMMRILSIVTDLPLGTWSLMISQKLLWSVFLLFCESDMLTRWIHNVPLAD